MDFIKISAVLFLLIQFSNISSGCPEGWKWFIDDQGFPDCFPCRKCPEGTTAVESCTKEHDTICDECTGDEYYHILSMQCKACTVCDAGYYVKMNCSRFKDTACDVCPTGTFSLVKNSSTCTNCTQCNGTQVIFRNCNNTVDTICGECTDDEYYHSISMQCKTCTVCVAGYYVKMNCSRFKDTACDACPSGTFSSVKNSSTCTNCTQCNRRKVIFRNCNNTVDTICGECTDEEYYHSKNMQCKTCTVCDAGHYVRSNCSMFNDTECNVCPSGTFSLVQNSSTCKKCTDCIGSEIIQGCTRVSDAICKLTGELGTVKDVIIICLIVCLICYYPIRRIYKWWLPRDGNNHFPGERDLLMNNDEDFQLQTVITTDETGNSSSREIEVNPNNKKTDKQYQRLESSKFKLEPYKELRGADKEQCMKSSMSSPGEMHERRHGHKVKATHVRNINVTEKSDKGQCWVTGLVVLSRDLMVVCDWWNNSVKLFDTKQNLVTSKIRLPSAPWDTALVPRDVTEESTTYDLVVTLPDDSKLRYVRVTGDQITDTNKDISVKGWCHGIQVTQDRKLAVGYYDPEKVEILDMDGQVLRRLETDHDGAQLFRNPWYLAVSPGSGILYVSDCGNNTLTSISSRDWSVMTNLEGLDLPSGVTVDRAGSVFVCCNDRTVHLVAATGDRSTQILGKEDGLGECPQAIGLSPEGDRMYVSGWLSDHVQEFQLTES